MSFTATYEDDTTGSVIPSSYTPTSFGDTAGTQTVTFSFAGTDITVDVDYDVEEPVVVVLDHLELTGDLTHTHQDRGSTPDASGVTVKAVYSDESEVTLTSDDYTVSAVPVDGQGKWAYGNPNNLQRGTITFSYTEDGVTKTAEKRPLLHYPTEQNLSANEAGHVYFDMDPDWYVNDITGLTGKSGLHGITDYFNGDCQVGEIVALPFLADDYDNDTPQTLASLTPYITALGGYVTSETGTPNDPNFIPEWNAQVRYDNGEFITNQCYCAVSINGNAQTAQGFDIMYVIGKLTAVDTTNGYKRTDFDLDDGDFQGAEYLVHVTAEGSGSSTTLYVGDSGTNTIEFSESVSSGVNYVGFFVDLGTGNPIEVDEGDVFWYFASDTDYQGDASLADVLTSMPDGFDAIGINVDTPEMVALTGPHISDQEWKIPLKGTGTLSASDTYHFVLAQAPTGTTADTSVVTFKCSDLVELDRQVVVFEPGHAPSP